MMPDQLLQRQRLFLFSLKEKWIRFNFLSVFSLLPKWVLQPFVNHHRSHGWKKISEIISLNSLFSRRARSHLHKMVKQNKPVHHCVCSSAPWGTCARSKTLSAPRLASHSRFSSLILHHLRHGTKKKTYWLLIQSGWQKVSLRLVLIRTS